MIPRGAPHISINIHPHGNSMQSTSPRIPSVPSNNAASSSGVQSAEAGTTAVDENADPRSWYTRVRTTSTVRASPRLTTPYTPLIGPAEAGHRRRLSTNQREPETPLKRFFDLGAASISALWVVEEASELEKRAHVHGDGDIDAANVSPSVPLPPAPLRFWRIRGVLGSGRTLSRWAYFFVGALVFFGLRELWSYSALRGGRSPIISVKRPRDALDLLAPRNTNEQSRFAAAQDRQWREQDVVLGSEIAADAGDTTAVVLHWKRTDNVAVIVAHLCQYSFFSTIFVWNNNPDIRLGRNTFEATGCPASKLRIYNSPQNLFFLARYLACASSSTPNCFFQDDDWLVRPIRALYLQFARDPEGPVVVHTTPEMTALYGLEWCFYKTPLHTCFSWVGTGAFSSKARVVRFMSTIASSAYTREELGHADNSFTTWQNEPPYVLSGELVPLPQPFGHSDGAGIARNKRIIQQGLVHVVSHLQTKFSTPILSKEKPTTPLAIPVSHYRTPSLPHLHSHPHAHHVRSPCVSDTCVFVTNIALLPPPDAVPYPGPETIRSLEEWENLIGSTARGWMEGGEMFNKEEVWMKKWPYSAAVDGKPTTAFRSPDVVRTDDYVGLGLLTPLDPHWVPNVTLHFILEHSTMLVDNLIVEVSHNGYRWSAPSNVDSISGQCHPISSRSTLPDISLPSSYLSSPPSLAIHQTDRAASEDVTLLSRWWRRRRRAAVRLSECEILVGTTSVGTEETGWRWIRLRAESEGTVGWGVYGLWLT